MSRTLPIWRSPEPSKNVHACREFGLDCILKLLNFHNVDFQCMLKVNVVLFMLRSIWREFYWWIYMCAFLTLWSYDIIVLHDYFMTTDLLLSGARSPLYLVRPTKVNTVSWLVDVTMRFSKLAWEFSLSVGGVDDCSMVKNTWICIFCLLFYTICLVEWSSELTKEGIVTFQHI